MDFISSLIKRPISLVLNETSTTMDKFPISSSLPNTPSVLGAKQDLITASNEQQNFNSNHNRIQTNNNNNNIHNNNNNNHNNRPLTMSSSYNDDIITDFIGVPEEFLGEFEDILPPPPLLQTSDALAQSTYSLSITPPPPPLPSHSLTSSMKTSRTIDELLLEINDNLQQAGLNDDVLAIASPPSKSELSPLSAKAGLNNSRNSSASNIQINTCKTPTKAAGLAASTVFENNSSIHKFHIDPEFAIDDHCRQQQGEQDQHQHVVQDQLNNSGVNTSSNKFVGLTEFDEAKIPELPGDLNPNIEEQYNVIFEKCFIPTLTTKQIPKKDECVVDKTHLLLPTETETAVSSDNETFADCNDEKDPLATTFAEPVTFDTTTDLESYQSAINNSMNLNLNNTMENIADLTMEAETHPLQIANQTQVVAEPKSDNNTQQFEAIGEDEPMDIDMNATMEILQTTSNNIQNVEIVLKHAENILQDLEEKKPLKEFERENPSEKQTETSKMTFVVNTPVESVSAESQHFEIEQSNHELSLNKSIELPVNKTKTVSSECIIEMNNNKTSKDEKNELEKNPEETAKYNNLTIDCMNSSNTSTTSSSKSPAGKSDAKLNLSLGLCTSINSQKSSAPNSPSFPIKHTQDLGFPRSPKAIVKKPNQSPFLEKSNYFEKLQTQVPDENAKIYFNETFVEASSTEETNKVSTDVETSLEDNKHLTKDEQLPMPKDVKQIVNDAVELRIKTTQNDSVDEKRQTFSVQSDESSKMQFPSSDKTDNSRRTFCINDTENVTEETISSTTKSDKNPRLTFVKDSEERSMEQTAMNTTFEPMEVDDTLPQNTTVALTSNEEQRSQSPPVPSVQQRSQTPPLPIIMATTQSPTLTTIEQKSQFPSLQTPPELEQSVNIKEKQEISPPFESSLTSISSQPLPALIQKRPSIRDVRVRSDILSAKEQSNIKVKDEKDIFVEKFTPSPIEEMFTAVSATSTTLTNSSGFSEFDQNSSTSSSSMVNTAEQQNQQIQQQFEDEFSGNNNLILNPSDFDYLLTKGNNNTPVDRSSLLLKFDPLLGVPVPVNLGQQLQQLQIPTNNINPCLSPTLEEDEHNDSNRSFVIEKNPTIGLSSLVIKAAKAEEITEANSAKSLKAKPQEVKQQQLQLEQEFQLNKRQLTQEANKKNATMSVDVIKDMSLDNDCNKTFENSTSTQSDDKQINYKMDELEKKIKNEVLKTEDIEKKLKDAEQREEALIKRITEKDKTVAKMTGVIEAYEKAIAELIAEKEQLIQNYEKQLAEAKADRDSNYHHLTSLETTFSDLHVKYEKSKEMTCQLKASEAALQAEKRKNLENLHLQEQRYDKMKNHAMQQLEIANKKLESLTRDHSIEITKLKALLKKEEIARSSINEQLAQKTKENTELVKICDELIQGQGS